MICILFSHLTNTKKFSVTLTEFDWLFCTSKSSFISIAKWAILMTYNREFQYCAAWTKRKFQNKIIIFCTWLIVCACIRFACFAHNLLDHKLCRSSVNGKFSRNGCVGVWVSAQQIITYLGVILRLLCVDWD